MGSLTGTELPYKLIRLPLGAYGFPQADALMNDQREVDRDWKTLRLQRE